MRSIIKYDKEKNMIRIRLVHDNAAEEALLAAAISIKPILTWQPKDGWYYEDGIEFAFIMQVK